MMRLPLTGMKDMVQSTLDMIRVRKDITGMAVDTTAAMHPIQLRLKPNRNCHYYLV